MRMLSVVVGASYTNREQHGLHSAGGPCLPAPHTHTPVGDVLRQVELAERGQQALHALLKALGGARVARGGDDRDVHVAAAAAARGAR